MQPYLAFTSPGSAFGPLLASSAVGRPAQYLLLGSVNPCIFGYHTRRSLRVYRITSGKKTSLMLMLHILSASFELLRYYAQAVSGDVFPDVFDIVGCFVHSATTLGLAKQLLRGDQTTRASYQAPALMRPFVALVALLNQSAFVHRASVKLLHAFLYTRLIIFLGKRFKMNKLHSFATIYAHGVFLGAVIAIHDSGLPAGVPVYIGMVGAVMVLNRYVADSCMELATGKTSLLGGYRVLLRILVWIGLADLDIIKKQGHINKEALLEKDQYTDE
ncbi:uncharacterized protein NECHADRAFT_82843 [Fusarium vanettenii 77-13-4]|uniref:Uncharacterized protein n=1 Tax=Fusarium vanettenii (strain ATCC MYA-4622 / CBS 123669 / FGSC 9596 / NRRL 45880 / 77-13-4) TaxID=660122 RepID=C7YX00_FUSV7|nr:uncharacterized protein NECHADRAFT_82843 [Fusarium vanettenii 77-13-4]EEU43741.1 hypothetical protein NECHADRAFT_82843 [Fusarium vanettenii 77-13-4]